MTIPGWREPMLATLTDRRFSADGWLFERKLDGVRAIGVRDGNRVELWSRTHKPMAAAYPEVAQALAAQGGRRFVVDGEIVAFAGERTSFAALQPRMQLTDPDEARATGITVYYYLFDLLHYDGMEAVSLPLRQRKQLLAEAFVYTDPLRLSRHRERDGEAMFTEACARGWEGLIAKRGAARYQSGRSRDWLKIKCVLGQEFVVGGFTDPQGSRPGFGALLLGYHDDTGLRYAGRVGTGFTTAVLHRVRSMLDELGVPQSPFADPPPEPGVHWVRPDLVVQAEFAEWTHDGRLRHARFRGLRDDRDPATVVREQRPGTGS